MRTQIGIVGAGPAGLMLAHLLHLVGIDSVIIEHRSRAYVESRVRAGLIEQNARDLLIEVGVGDRLAREGRMHKGIGINFRNERHRVGIFELSGGKAVTMYGQEELVKDLIAARLAADGQIIFEVDNVSIENILGSPTIRFEREGGHELSCDAIAGCDGFHGICRQSIPVGVLSIFERVYPFAWLGILSEAKIGTDEVIYTNHPRGFALQSMRTPELSRFHIQCRPDEDLSEWSDERIWDELDIRLATPGSRHVNRGPILQKGLAALRSFVAAPMRYGNLYLAGDAAHIVPPTGAKGMNLAIADVRILARAFAEFYRSGKTLWLEQYSDVCLRRVWKAQRFSWWMTSMLHHFEGSTFDQECQIAELDYVTSSRAAGMTLAENYVGLPYE